MITLIALGASIALFLMAAAEQLVLGNTKLAALYGCFAITNSVSLWLSRA